MKAECDANLAEWLTRKENVYTAPDIQNEIIKSMGIQILRHITLNLQSSPFLSIMLMRLLTCQIESKSHCSYNGYRKSMNHVALIDAATLTSVIHNIFMRLNLSFVVNVMTERVPWAEAKVEWPKELEPRALFTLYCGHSLNLAACDTIKKMKVVP